MAKAAAEGGQGDSVAPLLVGVGASGADEEAVCALVRALPADAPLGLLVLQHPGPTPARDLRALLTRRTTLVVVPAEDGARVGAGQVHVVPPGLGLRLAGGRLRLAARPAGAQGQPIDDLFSSLAADRGRTAAGVVLSGHGTDGAQGVCALRRAGARTFAQDQTALHAAMPAAAIASGCVDHVLAPAQIGARLVEAAVAEQEVVSRAVPVKAQADAAARRSELALREMLNAASEAIVISDRAGRITYANAMAARMFGYGAGELIGVQIEALVPEAAREAHAAGRAAFLSTPAPRLMGRDAHGRRRDGSLFPAAISLSAMEGEEGPLAVAFVADVTARRESEARIQAYKSALQQMAFDAALAEERQRRRIAADLHDNIGQSLALAMLRFKTAQAAGGQGGELAEGIALVERALADMRSLTFELSPPVLYDLGLPAALAWLGEQFEERHDLRVAVHVREPLQRLADQTAAVLFRAVRELLTNVVKHAQAPAAAVRLASPGSTFVVEVEDRGVGFDTSRLEDYGATRGFGLFSVREQVTQLGGTLRATSAAGSGTKVELRIPLDPWLSDLPPAEAG